MRGTVVVLALALLVACGSAASSDAPARIAIGARGGVLVPAFGSLWTTDLTLNRLVRIEEPIAVEEKRQPDNNRQRADEKKGEEPDPAICPGR